MAKPEHHVYFVHGIGQHSTGWLDDKDNGTTLRKQIADSWSLYADSLLSLGKMEEVLDLVPICYDDVYTKLYNHWEDSISSLKSHLAAFPDAPDVLGNLVDLAAAPAKGVADNKFFYTNILDLLWYWGNSEVQGKIVSTVASQIMKDVAKNYSKADHTFSIVAHSMGTSVIHKVLQALYTEPKYKQHLSSRLKFQVLMQVSNTSYVLSADRKRHYQTIVKPSANANRGVCWSMINAACRYDPVAEVVPFAPPPHWLDSYSQVNKCYLNVTAPYVSSPDVHSIVRYFENPLIHIPFFERVLSITITDAEKKKAIEGFEEALPGAILKQCQAQLGSLIQGSGKSASEFILTVKKFVEMVRSFK